MGHTGATDSTVGGGVTATGGGSLVVVQAPSEAITKAPVSAFIGRKIPFVDFTIALLSECRLGGIDTLAEAATPARV